MTIVCGLLLLLANALIAFVPGTGARYSRWTDWHFWAVLAIVVLGAVALAVVLPGMELTNS